jgi:hypothetical protein
VKRRIERQAAVRIPLLDARLPADPSRQTHGRGYSTNVGIRFVVTGKVRQRRVLRGKGKKETSRPEPFTGFESFHYFLTELELVASSDSIAWTPTSITAARRRLTKLLATLSQIGVPSRNGESS